MPHNLSSDDAAWILKQIGITLKRHGKEDVYSGEYQGKNRVVIVPRNKRSIPKGTLSSIWRQAGITNELADKLWREKNSGSSIFFVEKHKSEIPAPPVSEPLKAFAVKTGRHFTIQTSGVRDMQSFHKNP